MVTTVPLQPTAWRTCRALANRTRLAMLQLLLRMPDQTVSAVARQLRLPLSLTSEYLRVLEARGLLAACRRGRQVTYSPGRTKTPISNSGLAAALSATLGPKDGPLDTVFRLLTSFTHPRRVEIFRALQSGASKTERLRAVTGISERALQRHLQKLMRRGFVTRRHALFSATHPPGRLGRALARLALQ